MVDFATSQIHNVGNPNILNSAMNRNIFTPQALNAFRNVAASPLGTVGRTIFGIPAAVASTPFLARAGINYLTERDPNATRSSLFNIDLTKNANERAALPGSTLNDWGSPMGDVPDGGVVPPTKKINTPLPYQDRIMNENLMNMERGNIDNKGFNFPSIFGTVKGGLEWLGDKFKRPEAKQRAYESIMDTGTYKGNPYELYDTSSGLKIGSDILGTGQGYAKNFDSMFGSKSIEDMEQKKVDWALGRLDKFKDDEENLGISKRLFNVLRKRGVIDSSGNRITTPEGKDTITTTTTTGGSTTPNVHGGGSEASFTQRSPGGISQATSRAARTDQSGNVMSGWNLAEGGRAGLKWGGGPEEIQDDLSTFEFMQDQGVPYGEMASAVDPMDALNDMSMNVYGRPLHELTPEEYQILIDMANDQAAAPADGLASLV